MYTFEQNEIIIERTKSMRALYVLGGVVLTLSSATLLAFTRFIWVTSQESKIQLVLFSLLFAFLFILGVTSISQSGPYSLILNCSKGTYMEAKSTFGRKSTRTGPLSDFTSLKLTPMKDKNAGCVINLCMRARPLFPIQLETYYDYAQAREELRRLSEATGIPVVDAGLAGASSKSA